MSTPRILIAYDGSPNSRTAVEAAAALFPAAEAVIFFARQPMEGFAAHLQGHSVLERLEGVDAALLDASEQVATGGAEFARTLGLRAEPLVSSSVVSASEAIIAAAEERDSTLIVLGSRGRRRLAATVLGSTSANVLHHATRPTLVIPSDAVAAARSVTPRD